MPNKFCDIFDFCKAGKTVENMHICNHTHDLHYRINDHDTLSLQKLTREMFGLQKANKESSSLISSQLKLDQIALPTLGQLGVKNC